MNINSVAHVSLTVRGIYFIQSDSKTVCGCITWLFCTAVNDAHFILMSFVSSLTSRMDMTLSLCDLLNQLTQEGRTHLHDFKFPAKLPIGKNQNCLESDV